MKVSQNAKAKKSGGLLIAVLVKEVLNDGLGLVECDSGVRVDEIRKLLPPPMSNNLRSKSLAAARAGSNLNAEVELGEGFADFATKRTGLVFVKDQRLFGAGS